MFKTLAHVTVDGGTECGERISRSRVFPSLEDAEFADVTLSCL